LKGSTFYGLKPRLALSNLYDFGQV
jgi:hypothetical protein